MKRQVARNNWAGIVVFACLAASVGCTPRNGDLPFRARGLPEVVVDEHNQPLRFAEVTDGAFVGRGEVVVLDREAARLTLIRGSTRAKSLRLPDSTTGALLLGPMRADSVAVWDAFANSISVADASLSVIGRTMTGLPPLFSVVGIFSDGSPVMAPVRPLEASLGYAYTPDSVGLVSWTGTANPLPATLPQWPMHRLQVGESSAALGPVWARRGRAQVRGDTVWIGDGDRPVIVRADRLGVQRRLAFGLEPAIGNRSAEMTRRLALLPSALRDSARSLLESWALQLSPPFFSQFRIDRLGRVWVRLAGNIRADSATWAVFSSDSHPLARMSLPAGWRLLDANSGNAAFAVVDDTGFVGIMMVPLEFTRSARTAKP
jgi:hypothetical protein